MNNVLNEIPEKKIIYLRDSLSMTEIIIYLDTKKILWSWMRYKNIGKD